MNRAEYWRRMTQPTDAQTKSYERQAKREAETRCAKDLAGQSYMGKNQ